MWKKCWKVTYAGRTSAENEEKYYHKTLDLFQNIYDSGYVIYQLQENIKQRYNLEEGI